MEDYNFKRLPFLLKKLICSIILAIIHIIGKGGKIIAKIVCEVDPLFLPPSTGNVMPDTPANQIMKRRNKIKATPIAPNNPK